jgi:hypothetical protein
VLRVEPQCSKWLMVMSIIVPLLLLAVLAISLTWKLRAPQAERQVWTVLWSGAGWLLGVGALLAWGSRRQLLILRFTLGEAQS